MIALLTLLLAAKPDPYLAQARVFYQGGEYKSCLKRLEQAEKWDNSIDEQADVALYNGLCKFLARRASEAEADFALALKLKPTIELPPLTSPKVVAMFNAIPRAAPDPTPTPKEKPDDAPRVVERPAEQPASLTPATGPEESPNEELSQPPPRGVPVVPIVLGGAAVVSLTVASFLGLQASSADREARAAPFQSDAIAARQRADGAALGANLAFATAGALGIAGVIVFFATR